MFNTKGELIGIPSLKFSSVGRSDIASIEGIAMAIPMDIVGPVVSSLIQYGKVTRPKLGITVVTIRGSEEPTEGLIPAGIYVGSIAPKSPAEKAGLRVDDIITHVDGARVTLHSDLTNRIAGKTPGDHVDLTVYRIPGLSELTLQDRVPKGESLEIRIMLEILGEIT